MIGADCCMGTMAKWNTLRGGKGLGSKSAIVGVFDLALTIDTNAVSRR